LVAAPAAWWLEHRDAGTRDELTAALTDEVWVVIESTARSLGLSLDPDAKLPTTSG
jgi:hypothetical protein